jgi:hypothetical protein
MSVPNYFFVALRLGFALVMTGLYLSVIIFAPAPDPADTSGFDKRIFAFLMPFVLIPFIVAAVRAIVRIDLDGGLTVRRLIGRRRFQWADVTHVAFTTSRASFNLIPVAKFRSVTFVHRSGSFYIGITPQEEAAIANYLMGNGLGALIVSSRAIPGMSGRE